MLKDDKKQEITLESVIGLEIHVQLKTKSKMFCSCANIFGNVPPNSAICPICLGYPGTLPVPNQQAIKWTQLVGTALNCKLAEYSKFDRKHYFYPDLPKGYQISQYDQPFCGPGRFTIEVDGQERTIGITRAHLEEDAAKNTHPAGADYTLVDFNRAGTPLVEIVTEPDLRTPAEAKIFLQELQRLLRQLDVSDADMEKGQLRCDANISLRPKGTQTLTAKTEIKNLNSFRHVERALTYEIERQTKLHEQGQAPRQDTTRGYQADSNVTVAHRSKEEAADYRYFPEPDIPPFRFTAEELARLQLDLPELPFNKRARFIRQTSISSDTARLLADHPLLADFFENTVSELKQIEKEDADVVSAQLKPLVVRAANIILRELRDLVKQQQLTAATLRITPANFAETVVLLEQGKLNSNALAKLLSEMQRTGGDPDHLIAGLGLAQISDSTSLESHLEQVINQNPDIVAKVKGGKLSALQYLVGEVMKATRGQANPSTVMALLKNKIAIDKNKQD